MSSPSSSSSVVEFEAQVERRLSSVVDTQESVQSLSLWTIHHKAQHQRIVDVWLRVLRSAGVGLRLSLFHLCNEILQTCKRRNADSFKESFRRVLNDAVLVVRGSQIQSNVARILQIWTERSVYEGEYIEELLKVLYEQKQTKDDQKPSVDFKPKALMDEVRSFGGFWDELQKSKRFCSSSHRGDIDAIESLQLRLRDDHGCEDECRDTLVEMTKSLREDVDTLESVAKKRKRLLELLHLAEVYYDGQYLDASVVVQAYKNYGNRINNLKVKLNEQRHLLPDPRPQSETPTSADSKSESYDASALQHICAVMNKSLSSANNNRDKTGLDSFLSGEGQFMTFLPRSIPSLDCQYSIDIQGEHQVRTFASGDGDSTPVQDEPPDDPSDDPPGDPPLPYHDPMEFLSQLINKSTGRSSLLPSTAACDSSSPTNVESSRSDVLSWSSEDVVVGHAESLRRGADSDRSASTIGQGDNSHVRDGISCDHVVCRDDRQTRVAPLSSADHAASARHDRSSLPECFRADKPYNCSSGNNFSSQTNNCIKKNIPDHRSVQTATDRNDQNSDAYSHYMT